MVLDLDNTLYPYEPCHEAGMSALLEAYPSQLGMTPRAFQDGWEQARTAVKDRLGSVGAAHSRLLYLEQMMLDMNLGFRPSVVLQAHQSYWAAFLSYMQLRNGVEEFLLECRQNNIKIVVLTDLTSEIQLRKVVRLGLSTLIDQLISSEFVGAEKDTMAGYDYLLATRSSEILGHTWFIGDGPHDFPTTSWLGENHSNLTSESFSIPETDFIKLTRILKSL